MKSSSMERQSKRLVLGRNNHFYERASKKILNIRPKRGESTQTIKKHRIRWAEPLIQETPQPRWASDKVLCQYPQRETKKALKSILYKSDRSTVAETEQGSGKQLRACSSIKPQNLSYQRNIYYLNRSIAKNRYKNRRPSRENINGRKLLLSQLGQTAITV
jgi:hypothetical protein